MQPLIDGDILIYESGFAVETAWGENRTEERPVPPFEWAAIHIDHLISNICAMVDATEPPIIYLTGKTNFRNEIAKRNKYKQRDGNKPFHYNNLKAYIKGKYDFRTTEGLEADDLMAIEQTARPNETILCSRDKDLRTVAGWSYSWELQNQPSFGPEIITELGYINYNPESKKLSGTGMLFFYAQCIMGDPTDSIEGIPRYGPKKAFDILKSATSIEEAYEAVIRAYRAVYEDAAEIELLEQGRLLWMTRELNADGSPKLWELLK